MVRYTTYNLAQKDKEAGLFLTEGSRRPGWQQRDVGGVAARWCSGEQSPCGAWGRGRRGRLQATSSTTRCSSEAQWPELAFEVAGRRLPSTGLPQRRC